MSEWGLLLGHGLWLSGLALFLMTISLARWSTVCKKSEKQHLRQTLAESRFAGPIWLSLALVSLGLFVLAGVWWESLIWGIYILIFLRNWWLHHAK